MLEYGTAGLDLRDADSPFMSAIVCISEFSFAIEKPLYFTIISAETDFIKTCLI